MPLRDLAEYLGESEVVIDISGPGNYGWGCLTQQTVSRGNVGRQNAIYRDGNGNLAEETPCPTAPKMILKN